MQFYLNNKNREMTKAAANLLYRNIQNSPRLAGRTQIEIAREAKMHQSQVSRIMRGQFKRVTAKSILKLCEFARIKATVNEPLSAKLQKALKGIWDGSRSQEQALVRLLKAADLLALAHSAKADRRIRETKRKRGK
jgi:transcriptional regulator with XRE-family HTH domain